MTLTAVTYPGHDVPRVTIGVFNRSASVTALRMENRCSLSGKLYEEHKREARTDRMELGIVVHRILELCVRACIEHGEPVVPPTVAKAIAQEVMEDPEYRVALEAQDYVREAVFRWASEFECDPTRTWVEEAIEWHVGGWTIRMRVDLIRLSQDSKRVRIEDYKSGRAMPGYEDIGRKRRDGTIAAKDFQLVMYALGVLSTHRAGGPTAQHVDLAYVYPGVELKDGAMGRREVSLTRLEALEYLDAVKAQLKRMTAMEAGDAEWKATSGAHCSECPASTQCTIPVEAREFAGSIIDPQQAQVMAANAHVPGKWLQQVRADINRFVKLLPEQRLRFGRDQVIEVTNVEKQTVDRAGMLDAAAQSGGKVDPQRFIKGSVSSTSKWRTLNEAEMEAES